MGSMVGSGAAAAKPGPAYIARGFHSISSSVSSMSLLPVLLLSPSSSSSASGGQRFLCTSQSSADVARLIGHLLLLAWEDVPEDDDEEAAGLAVFLCVSHLSTESARPCLGGGELALLRVDPRWRRRTASAASSTWAGSGEAPGELRRLASDFLYNYIFVTVGRVGSSTDLIEQKIEFVNDGEKRGFLIDLLQKQSVGVADSKQPLTLVFVETKREADSLRYFLRSKGFPATAIHGDRTQQSRESALKSFKSGATPIMVATDVASRGLDAPNVAHVINYDLPKSIEDYVHRIGRTGRAGKAGIATAFFTESNQPLAKGLLELMTKAKRDVPEWLVEYANRPCYGGSSYGGRGRRGGGGFGGRDYRWSSDYGYGGDGGGYSSRGGSYSGGGGYSSRSGTASGTQKIAGECNS
ncbi:DEAD-box ATP-dependent RNA helicase 52A-like [Miscanthus floridulus]|uniref:DEAD-box ATP-dependent RNA helicase 52A-like n=1 Tax=Miscanthus floridulus TaxID=154761 RepID=UPI0034582E1D